MYRILVVEDEDDIQKILEKLFDRSRICSYTGV